MGLFERVGGEAYSVFQDKGVLSLSYVPDVLVCRVVQEEYLARMLVQGVSDNFLPPMIRVFGGTGCGKTAVVVSVLERFQGIRGDVFRWFYVNLKDSRTVFSAANMVLSAVCGRNLPVNLGLDRVFEEIWSGVRALKAGRDRLFLCLVLDEVDAIFMDTRSDPSDFFYRFVRHQAYLGDQGVKICLVVITNNLGVLEDHLDRRVKSSIGDEMVFFPYYSGVELMKILEARLAGAFKEGMVEKEVAACCALLVAEKSGDARRAVDLLRVSGEVANEQKSKVTIDCVIAAQGRVEKDWTQNMLGTLSINSGMILGYIAFISKDREKTTARAVYTSYRNAKRNSKEKKAKVLGERRILDIINELETLGLISTWNISRGRYGYQKEIKINIDPHAVLDFYEHTNKKFTFRIS